MHIDLYSTDRFANRHIGPDAEETQLMLKAIGVNSMDELIDQTVPDKIRLEGELDLPRAVSEHEYLQNLKEKAAKNKLFKTYIGMGYSNTIVPGVIQRNILENPGWYTQYTPYQAEIAQGRLEALLNFQTMVSDLTALPVANASLLDEGTAAAEAMSMLFSHRNKRKIEAAVFVASDKCLPQTLDLLKTRALPIGVELKVVDIENFEFDNTVFGALLQYPGKDGYIANYRELIEKAHAAGTKVVMAADIMSLALLTPPGELGADVAVGNTQRLGVPLGYGGPHAAYFACREDYTRIIPGRIIGVSVGSNGEQALRMALQTREQHIRREKATSNICTAQALLAIMAGMYGVYHGPKGLKAIATRIHQQARVLSKDLKDLGYQQDNEFFFDTLKVNLGVDEELRNRIKSIAVGNEINFGFTDENEVVISLDEATMPEDVQAIAAVFATAKGITTEKKAITSIEVSYQLQDELKRTSDYLTHPVFNSHQSETEMLRYIKSLEAKDLSLTQSMIALGSCTMKLNATTQLVPISWPEFSNLHPFVPGDQALGYREMIIELERYLNVITGFDATSLQPNSGAQGEYAGLMVIRAYQEDEGQGHRNIALIPSSAHGTNPASAVMAGMKVVVTKCDENGNIDIEDLRAKAEQHKENLSCLMITYPSTHGVFEEGVMDICQIIHDNGGQVYMDGANMNAQVGLTNPATIGADVCHLNLHKTFSIPHGGGGPGMGPICVREHLAPFLPTNSLVPMGGDKAIPAISAAPWGSASILLISYAYIQLLGTRGATDSTKYAILGANYIKKRIEKDYKVLFTGANDRVAHELIVDFREFKAGGIEVEDVAKRLIDYGFHAPTMSWPVPGTMMIEPTESEDMAELDRFCDALLSIKKEIEAVITGTADLEDNVLKNAPHTVKVITADEWTHKYGRQQAAFPLPYVVEKKFWPAVGRVNNSHGDRNLICTCPSVESYMEEVAE